MYNSKCVNQYGLDTGMAKSSTSFGKEQQPDKRRGRSKRTLILEAIKKESLMGTHPDASNEEVEVAFFSHIAKRAGNPEDQNSGMCLRLLADKGWSNVKPTMEHVEFTFDETATPAAQANQVMKAASQGLIAPDVANMFISSIASLLKIEEVTELRAQVEAIKEALEKLKNDG